MKLYKTNIGSVCLDGGNASLIDNLDWNDLFMAEEPAQFVEARSREARPFDSERLPELQLLAPMADQEIWGAGVTYHRSRDARMAESETAGGGSFYERVYDAERPELFFKGSQRTVVGHDDEIRIRSDAKWSVPEPELTLAISSSGNIFGFTVGNDVSARDIEGENPLYLPQAKVYDGSCALGPALLLSSSLNRSTEIVLTIERDGEAVAQGTTTISEIVRSFESLAAFLFRQNTFAAGALLMTGTGIVPPESFTLRSGDIVSIEIDPIGKLVNRVE